MNNLKMGDIITASDTFEAKGLIASLAREGVTAEMDGTRRVLITKTKLSGSISSQLEELASVICDNFCKYAITCDENCECDWTRTGRDCPLDPFV